MIHYIDFAAGFAPAAVLAAYCYGKWLGANDRANAQALIAKDEKWQAKEAWRYYGQEKFARREAEYELEQLTHERNTLASNNDTLGQLVARHSQRADAHEKWADECQMRALAAEQKLRDDAAERSRRTRLGNMTRRARRLANDPIMREARA